MLSAGLPLYNIVAYEMHRRLYKLDVDPILSAAEIKAKDLWKNVAAHAAGASIPFAVYYAKDIADLLVRN